MNGYKMVLGRYAQFGGRSGRAEYWGWVLVNVLIGIVANVLLVTVGLSDDGPNVLGWILVAAMAVYGLFIIIPNVAVAWRRYQDIGWAGAVSIVGWFVPFLTLVVALIPGNPGPNQYGPEPR